MQNTNEASNYLRFVFAKFLKFVKFLFFQQLLKLCDLLRESGDVVVRV